MQKSQILFIALFVMVSISLATILYLHSQLRQTLKARRIENHIENTDNEHSVDQTTDKYSKSSERTLILQNLKARSFAEYKNGISKEDPFEGIVQNCAICTGSVPCSYGYEVDIRILVLTYDRSASLLSCLKHIEATEGDFKVAVEIWIDRSKDGKVPVESLQVAVAFKGASKLYSVCVHVQEKHSFITKQWLNAWRPSEQSTEIGLFLEDDVDISPYALKWLMAAHQQYKNDQEIYGYSLQMEHVMAQTTRHDIITAPNNEPVFKLPILGTYGFAPKAKFWRSFQEFYYSKILDVHYKPYVEGLRANGWYKGYERNGFQESMAHEMWFIHFVLNHRRKTYCLYSNLAAFTGQDNVYLSSHRAEKGLHSKGTNQKSKSMENLNNSIRNDNRQEVKNKKLLQLWKSSFVTFPDDPTTFDAFGNRVHQLE